MSLASIVSLLPHMGPNTSVKRCVSSPMRQLWAHSDDGACD
jgi:hypothetical protein